MTLYEIDTEITACLTVTIDPETGEVTEEIDEARLEELQMERDRKIGGICCWIKDGIAESKAIAEEIKALQKRKRIIDNRVDRLTAFLQRILGGEKWKDSRSTVSYRTSTSVEVSDGLAKKWCRVKLEPDKTAIKEALKAGKKIKGAELVTKTTMKVA